MNEIVEGRAVVGSKHSQKKRGNTQTNEYTNERNDSVQEQGQRQEQGQTGTGTAI